MVVASGEVEVGLRNGLREMGCIGLTRSRRDNPVFKGGGIPTNPLASCELDGRISGHCGKRNFGSTREQAIELGQEANDFTARALAKPFTIQTRWRPVVGPTRYYAFVVTVEGTDLCELLIKNGLARIYGTRTLLPDGRTSRQYLAYLAALEQQAKNARLGGWRW